MNEKNIYELLTTMSEEELLALEQSDPELFQEIADTFGILPAPKQEKKSEKNSPRTVPRADGANQ